MNFDLREFYGLGIICWSVIVLMGIINFFLFFEQTYLTTKIANLFNLFFNIGIIGLFITLRKQTGFKQTTIQEFEELEKLSKTKRKWWTNINITS